MLSQIGFGAGKVGVDATTFVAGGAIINAVGKTAQGARVAAKIADVIVKHPQAVSYLAQGGAVLLSAKTGVDTGQAINAGMEGDWETATYKVGSAVIDLALWEMMRSKTEPIRFMSKPSAFKVAPLTKAKFDNYSFADPDLTLYDATQFNGSALEYHGVVKSSSRRAFWSGGGRELSGAHAMKWDKRHGYVTLEMTPAGYVLDNAVGFSAEETTRTWGLLSVDHARGARGFAPVFVAPDFLRPGNELFGTELPILLKNKIDIGYKFIYK